ncbi:hypothetical protein [Methanobrevibacter sp.]|uniref:hypothetical protein n=1 Tax=Methanobrevibacter sp. TaxID=66852 RepID=UPI00386D247B
MKIYKSLLLIAVLALVVLLVAGTGFASDNSTIEQKDFDSYFKMKVPKGITFEKKEGTPTNNINISVNYKNYTEKINIIYAESTDAKDNLLKYYEDMAKNDENITLKSYNNTTVIHFKGNNIIGEDNYHDMAISGDNTRYILLQCDNETLMKTMAESIKFS